MPQINLTFISADGIVLHEASYREWPQMPQRRPLQEFKKVSASEKINPAKAGSRVQIVSHFQALRFLA